MPPSPTSASLAATMIGAAARFVRSAVTVLAGAGADSAGINQLAAIAEDLEAARDRYAGIGLTLQAERRASPLDASAT